MKYVSIDIETTGLNPETCQVLSIGAVIEDTDNIMPVKDLPTFHGVMLSREISGDPYALNMNKDLIESMVYWQTGKDDERYDLKRLTGLEFYEKDEIVKAFYNFLLENGFEPSGEVIHLTVAGKNFGTFDLKFLEKLPRWKQYIRVRQRILDPSILYVDWKEDSSLPGLGTCKKRANLPEEVAHDAVEDAIDVILLLRKEYNPGY